MILDFLDRINGRLSASFTGASFVVVDQRGQAGVSSPVAVVYQLRLDEENQGPLWLTPMELERRDRLLQPAAQRQFARTRSALRELLSLWLNCHPLDVRLAVDEFGKPYVPGSKLKFNVSHTSDLALIAFANVRVGVDVEPLADRLRLSQLVQRYFSDDERYEFEQLPEKKQVAGFYRGWTGKEALLKGLGTGIRQLERVSIRLDPDWPSEILGDAELRRNWQLGHWTPRPGYIAAIALETREPLELHPGGHITLSESG